MDEPAADPHADERQIKLDTDRSFVLYPGGTEVTPSTLSHTLNHIFGIRIRNYARSGCTSKRFA